MTAINPSTYGATLANGSTGTSHTVTSSPAFSQIIPGQVLYQGAYYNVVRVSGTATATLRNNINWTDSAGASLGATFVDTVIDASTGGWVYTESKHTAPANAAALTHGFIVTPAASPMQHDVSITRIRLAKTQNNATAGATWGVDVSGRPANLSALAGTEGIQNTLVGLTAAGALTGAGGGTINALNVLNGPVDAGADLTLIMTGSKTINIACDYTGAPKAGQFPLDALFTLKSGANTDVTTSASWSTTVTSGSATATPTVGTPNATGDINVTALGTVSATITVAATYSGKTRTGTLVMNKINDPPPSAPGGSNPGTTANTSTIANTTATTYGTANTSILSIVAGTAGQVACTISDAFRRTGNGTNGCYGKWQWRVVAGTFADITTEIHSTVDANRQNTTATNDPGQIDVNMTKTGLTSGTTYEFQLLLRNDAAGTCNHSGTATAAGS